MGGSLGGMMMRVANSMGMGCNAYVSSAPVQTQKESWAEKTSDETEGELQQIKLQHERTRRWVILKFIQALKENEKAFVAAGLILPGDKTLMQIVCRAYGIPYCKRQTRKERYGIKG